MWFSTLFGATSSARCRAHFLPALSRPSVEALEGRCMPACIVTEVGSTLFIVGDAANNAVVIEHDASGNGQVRCDGVVTSYSGVSRVVVQTRGGDDDFDFLATGRGIGLPLTLQVGLGAGNDSFAVDMGFLDPIQLRERSFDIEARVAISLQAGAGDDAVFARFGDVTTGAGSGLLVNVQLGQGDDVLDAVFEGFLQRPTRLTVQGGAGCDSINAVAAGGQADVLSGGQLVLNLYGQNGDDSLGAFFDGRILAPGSAITVDGGRGDDLILAEIALRNEPSDPAAALGVRVRGGEGDDILTMLLDGDRAPTAGSVFSVDGGAGFDFGLAGGSFEPRVAVRNTEG